MNKQNMNVLINIIGAVESGGQIYGNRRYNAYTPPYQNTSNEHTITLGWAQNYGGEAKKLIQLIYDKNPSEFKKIDTNNLIYPMLSKDWVSIRWNPNSNQKAVLIKLIDSQIGHEAQDELFAKVMEQFIDDCANTYTLNIPAQMMYCEIRHLGGKRSADRIFKRCNNNYSLSNIEAALKQDQSDTSSSNQVGDKKFWSRHQKCIEFIKKYTVNESSSNTSTPVVNNNTDLQKQQTQKYDVNKLINIATNEIGYLEKKSNSQLDNKTANAGSNNYTKYWRDVNPSYQGQAWCDCFVDWCFIQAYGKAAAQELECGGCGEFYTPTSAQCYKNKKQWFTSPKVGDQIFFRNSERICHTGIVVEVNSSTVTTIEGNTSGASGVIANGGGVCKKTYALNNSRIAGYGHPNYNKEVINSNNITSTSTKEIQHMLNLLGQNLVEDNIFGNKTLTAVKNFQAKNNLTVDGIVGKKTLSALKEAVQKINNNKQTPAATPKPQTQQLTINTTGIYNESVMAQGKITKTLNIRKGPGTKYNNLISYPTLPANTIVGICDLIRGADGGKWYFIKISGTKGDKHGFASANYINLI